MFRRTRRGRTVWMWRGRFVNQAIWPLAAVLVVALVGQQPVAAARPRPPTLAAQQVPSIHGQPVAPRPRPASLTHGPAAPPPARVVWPAAGSATVGLTPGVGVRAGGLPVWVTGALRPGSSTSLSAAGLVSRVRVDVLDRASVPAGWRNGVLLRLSRADGVAAAGNATVSVDYSGFADAFGADYANRLRLMALPECALSTVEIAGCGGTALASTNDSRAKMVSAQVPLAGSGTTVVALTAGASGSSGTFAASSLSPASSWSAGGNSGDFSWQYPIDVPPSLGGPAPQVALSYSSSSVDGRNETTNNQPSWVGEGFDFWPGYIERSYKPCSDDRTGGNNTQDTGDECWGTNNAVLSMSGRGGELVRNDHDGTWRLPDDDNSRIEHLFGGHSGDNDGEYWRLTTTDGTQYYFGLNQLPGYTGTAPADKTTGSVWTEPVAGNNSGEPCHATSFTDSFCQQAWRWNLDYVVDPHGNTMSLFYRTESNHYARNNTDTDVQSYVRGGWLDTIYYGTDNRTGTDTMETAASAPMRLHVDTDDRCLSSCGTHDVAHWSDTPWDQSCTSATSCPGLYSPTFWLTQRLKTITTSVWDPAAARYKDVDSWTLTHTYPPSGDETRNGLWLASIVHTGTATGPAVVGSAINMPSVNFDWTQMANRVDPGNDNKPPMNWMRLNTIWTETGDKISIRYTDKDCVVGSRMPTSPQNNTLRCYPVLEEQPDKSITSEYFHKYLVSSVTEADWLCDPAKTPCSPDVVTSYEYVGAPAWRHADDDGMTKDNLRTWSDFRGYGQVNTRVGTAGGGQQTLSEATFFRGMNGDLNGSGGTRLISLPALDLDGDGDTNGGADAPAVPDDNAYAGVTRQSTVYNGVETDPISTTVNQPWQSDPTATRNMGQTFVYARHTGTAATWSATKLAAGQWRVTRADTTFDDLGMPARSNEQGDVAVAGDEKCTTTSYNRNTDANLLDLPAEVDVYAIGCPSGAPSPGGEDDIISMTRTPYDHQTYGAPPSRGEATETDVAKAWDPTAGPSWLVQSTGSYDAYGRIADITDVRGNHTTTAYTPAAGAPVTQTAVTTALGTTTSTLEPSWGSVTATVDVNNRRTDATYDPIGRTKQVWQPNHTKASFATQPNSSYDYLIGGSGGANAVTTNTLNAANTYTTSIALYDGLLRPRQSQTISAADGHVGTVFSDTRYDAAGRAYQQSQHFDATVQPSTTLFAILDWQPKTQTVTQYDRAGRPIAQIVNNQGVEKWRTITSYGGDRVNVIPPDGGTATTTITDALDRTVEVRQYHDPGQVGADDPSLYDRVTYHYNRKGQQDSWSDNAGNTWTARFDLLGRQTAAHDPDTGDSSSSYNDQGDLLTATDGRSQTLAYSYDALGRKTGEYTPTTAGTKLATWAYDPSGGKGHLASSSRWIGTDEYKIAITGYTSLYQPTGERYTIPASQIGLAGTYTYGHSYAVDGSPSTLTYAAGSLGAETITYHYDTTTGLPTSLTSNNIDASGYVAGTSYTAYGELSQVIYDNAQFGSVKRQFSYEEDTRRLNEVLTTRQTSPSAVSDTRYTYNPAGDITKTATATTGTVVDTQCFSYDWAQRLNEAWTPASGDCGQTKSAAALSGPAPYWQSWTFDAVGDRGTQTDHTTAGDTVTTSFYPAAGPDSTRPHALDHTTTRQPDGSTTTTSYAYDPAGNTTSRPAPGAGGQNLFWDAEGNLATVEGPGGNSSYIYDADGNRLLATDPGSTTLYLPGQDVIRNNATGIVSTTRYISWAGQVCAMYSNNNPSGARRLTWLLTDQQGTQQTEIEFGNQAITQRWQTPYGNPRGTQPAWLNNRGFVGGVNDPTGLIHEGAREYDPALGRFISADPEFDAADPQSWQGYGYADNNPITGSDPTGTYRERGGGGENDKAGDPNTMGCSYDDKCIPDHPPAAPPPHKKKHHWWDKVTNFVEEHKAQIAGFVVGAVVGVGCGLAIGWTGVGAVACGFLAGAAGSLTQDLVEGGHSLGGIIADTIIGGVVGGALGGLGSIAGAAGKAAAGAVKNGVVAAARAGARAATKEAGDIAAGRITGGALSGNTLGGLARKVLGGGGCHSFTPNTPVLMADGTTKPIANVAVGDWVQSSDPPTGQTTAEPVIALHYNYDTDLADITLKSGTGTVTVLHTTWHHAFWNDTTQQWTEAADLKRGTQLHTINGDTAYVVAVRTWTGLHDMRDLTIADVHSYYVLAGNTPVLVHNNGGDDWLYRGLASDHPGLDEARRGIATPRGGHNDPDLHAGGNTRSNFTSWTTDFDTALDISREGFDPGVVLRVPRSAVASQIVDGVNYPYEEAEVTLRGQVTGAEARSSLGGATFSACNI
jgi:RHS repeat-associated protein